ncbi:MAG: rRNA pseudouridine synthase [SAR324 cluster bacterium]|nr:rRNA pseudouridine synthase [SAR324 cluster bacterium]MBL7035084.1 rRNA pseudouridine synthase [SAR324 cluster bacterium]
MENLHTTKDAVRIQKVIAQAGIASRRAAEKLILAGEVVLNGEVVREMGLKMVVGKDHLSVEGKRVKIPQRQKTLVYALYKPKNCITTLNDPEGRTTIGDFFPRSSARLFPVGRLDYDAEGLILLTNDGDLAQELMHPRHKVSKGYFVKVRGLVKNADLSTLRKGPMIEKRQHLPVQVKVLHTVNDKTWLEVFLKEGTNRQIKKMFLTLGYPVQKIKRFQVGPINLGDLQSGESRALSPEELKQIMK